jgi:hypothetical protein
MARESFFIDCGGSLPPSRPPPLPPHLPPPAALTIFCYVVYVFGESRGWWDPIKERIPAIPGLSSFFGGRGGV